MPTNKKVIGGNTDNANESCLLAKGEDQTRPLLDAQSICS